MTKFRLLVFLAIVLVIGRECAKNFAPQTAVHLGVTVHDTSFSATSELGHLRQDIKRAGFEYFNFIVGCSLEVNSIVCTLTLQYVNLCVKQNCHHNIAV